MTDDPDLIPDIDADDAPTAELPELEDAVEEEGGEIDLSTAETRRGVEVVQAMVKLLLPNSAGRLPHAQRRAGDVLYVGKAKSLRKRVTNYTRLGQLPTRILRMVQATGAMEFVVCQDRDGGAAPRSQPDQAAEAALQRPAAETTRASPTS